MAAGIRSLVHQRMLAELQGEMDRNIELARLRTPQQADELGPVFDELEQNVDDARRIGIEKNEGLSPEMRPLKGLPAINRGGMKILSPGQNFTTIVSNMHSPPEDAEMIAVSIGITPFNEIDDESQQIQIVGKVEWGMGGASFQAFMDFYDGLVFSVPGCKVRVSAAYQNALVDQEGINKVNVNAGLAYGIFVQQSSSTRFTQQLAPLDPGQAFQVQIPPFATSFTLLSVPSSVVWPPGPLWTAAQVPTAILVSETSTPGLFERRALFQLTDNTNVSLHIENQFPLFNGSRFITIRNNGNVQAQYVLVYNLAF